MKNGEQLKDIIQDSLTYLDTCTELWCQEKPIWSWEGGRKIMVQKYIKASHKKPSDPAKFLLKSLNDINGGKGNLVAEPVAQCFLFYPKK